METEDKTKSYEVCNLDTSIKGLAHNPNACHLLLALSNLDLENVCKRRNSNEVNRIQIVRARYLHLVSNLSFIFRSQLLHKWKEHCLHSVL